MHWSTHQPVIYPVVRCAAKQWQVAEQGYCQVAEQGHGRQVAEQGCCQVAELLLCHLQDLHKHWEEYSELYAQLDSAKAEVRNPFNLNVSPT